VKKNERERETANERNYRLLWLSFLLLLSLLFSLKKGGEGRGGANSKIFEIFSLEEKRTREKNKKQVKIHPIKKLAPPPPPPQKNVDF